MFNQTIHSTQTWLGRGKQKIELFLLERSPCLSLQSLICGQQRKKLAIDAGRDSSISTGTHTHTHMRTRLLFTDQESIHTNVLSTGHGERQPRTLQS